MLRSIAFAGLLAALPVQATPVEYGFDVPHTRIDFYTEHVGFSMQQGTFRKLEGGFRFDPADWSTASIDVTIDVASLDMGLPAWNEHMRSADFFDVAKHPTARFRSTRVESAGGRLARMHGDLTIRGKTRPVVLDVAFNRIGVHPVSKQTVAGFSAATRIDRTAFGVGVGSPGLGEIVELRIEVEGVVRKRAP